MKKINLIPLTVMLSGGLVACIVSIVKRFSSYKALLTIFVALLIFYIIGLIAKAIIGNVVKKMEAEQAAKEEAERLEQERLEAEEAERINAENGMLDEENEQQVN